MLYKMRQRFNSVSISIGIAFSKLRLSPNHWTLLTIIPVLAAFYFILQESFLFAALFFIIAAFLDLVDGSVARVTGRVTQLGAYLDTIMDRYVEFIIIFSLLFIQIPAIYVSAHVWLFIYLFGAMLTTYAKAAASEKLGKEVKGGLFERAERLLLLFLGILLAHFSIIYLAYIIIILAVVSNITAIQRIITAAR